MFVSSCSPRVSPLSTSARNSLVALGWGELWRAKKRERKPSVEPLVLKDTLIHANETHENETRANQTDTNEIRPEVADSHRSHREQNLYSPRTPRDARPRFGQALRRRSQAPQRAGQA